MSTSVYTLLIVESPVAARIIQKLCPASVYVIATEGFCWRPQYDETKNQLKAVADPGKAGIRKEIKEQAKWANSVIIATDSDPSGDFITWSVARFLNSNGIKSGRIQNLSKKGIYSMLSEIQQLDENHLENRLKNHFLIRSQWEKNKHLPELQLAGLIAAFGAGNLYRQFLNEDGILFKSSEPIPCAPDELITVYQASKENHYGINKPLSTFDIIAAIKELKLSANYNDAQLLLQQLFQTTLQFSDESLISYPRTDANAFYSETWESIRNQYLKMGSINRLKPTYLQEIADSDAPHESVYPLNLSLKPDEAAGELSSATGQLYEWIYSQTIKSITMPDIIEKSFLNELNPGIYFYSNQTKNQMNASQSLHPCITVSELGDKLSNFGILKPSTFGKTLDDWISNKWIYTDKNVVYPGKPVLQRLGESMKFRDIFLNLNQLRENSSLTAATVQSILSS